MKVELTSEMHSEFQVSEESEIINRSITLWCFSDANDKNPDFAEECAGYGLTVEQAMKYKEYCLGLK